MILLEIAGGPAVDLDEIPTAHWTKVEFSLPDIRDITDTRVDAHGTIDQTAHYGARTVTIEGTLEIGTRQPIIDRLAPFMNPAARPILTYRFDDGSLRRIQVRASGATYPISAGPRDVQLQFKCPLGVIESDVLHTASLDPIGTAAGRIYPLIFPRTYPISTGSELSVVNAGDLPADFTARIFGPITNPKITNVTVDRSIVLRTTIASGDWISIASFDRSILDRGEPEATRYGWLDYSNTRWWQLVPGENRVYLTTQQPGGSYVTPAMAEISWRDAYAL